MGTVTNLADFRNKKAMATDVRAMEFDEWLDYLDRHAAEWTIDAELRRHAVERCFEIVESLATLEWNAHNNQGQRRFSLAVIRGQYRVELLDLVRTHGFIEFSHWL